MKLLAKQKVGKARLKERSMYVSFLRDRDRFSLSLALIRRVCARSGRVTIPTEAFHAVLGGQEIKRKGGSGSAAEKKRRG